MPRVHLLAFSTILYHAKAVSTALALGTIYEQILLFILRLVAIFQSDTPPSTAQGILLSHNSTVDQNNLQDLGMERYCLCLVYLENALIRHKRHHIF